MHKLTITLKQHTPLIHFQHDQDGATLRASEVKPKLDRYIIQKVFNNNYDECKEYLVGYDKQKPDKLREKFNSGYRALDYKMRIESGNQVQIEMNVVEKKENGNHICDEIGRPLFTTSNYPDNTNSLIMGNMGGRIREDVLNFVMFDDVSLYLLFKNESLKRNVNRNIFFFFSETNFGNRTSKGFGSFMVRSIDDVVINKRPSFDWKLSFSLMPDSNYSISSNRAIKDIFVIINKIWKGLKRYSNAPENQLKSVFLNVESDLTNDEDRIPSPVYFKPIVKSRSREEWVVDVMVFLNQDVIEAANANIQDFYDLLDKAVKYANKRKPDEDKNNYYVSNITVE